MSVHNNRQRNALKHGGFSATSILPGEDAAEFEKLHQALVSEFRPTGVLEQETIASLAHMLWRKKNLVIFRTAQRAQQRGDRNPGGDDFNSLILLRHCPVDRTIPKTSRKVPGPQKQKRARNCEICTAWSKWAMR